MRPKRSHSPRPLTASPPESSCASRAPNSPPWSWTADFQAVRHRMSHSPCYHLPMMNANTERSVWPQPGGDRSACCSGRRRHLGCSRPSDRRAGCRAGQASGIHSAATWRGGTTALETLRPVLECRNLRHLFRGWQRRRCVSRGPCLQFDRVSQWGDQGAGLSL